MNKAYIFLFLDQTAMEYLTNNHKMGKQIRNLLAGKFGSLAVQLFLTFVVIIKHQNNINNSSYSSASEARTSLTACIILSLFCQIFELIFIFTGLSIFFDKINVFSITFQSLGVLFTAWFILGEWASELLWPIWLFGALIPFLLEILILILSKRLYSPPIVLETE